MRRLTPAELRFLIRYALCPLPKSLLGDIQTDRAKRDQALDMAAERVCESFEKHEVLAPDPVQPS